MNTDKAIQIRVSDIVEDFDLYPRAQVDALHIGHLAEAYRCKVEMPYIIVDKKTKRLIDGMHRKRAYAQVFGQDAKITVISRAYKSESEMFVDAMRLNSGHGRNLSPYDRSLAIAKAFEMKLDPAMIAEALRMSVEKVTEMKPCAIDPSKVRPAMAFVVRKGGKDGPEHQQVHLKMPVRHMAGEVLSTQQADAMQSLGGNNQMFYVNQLITLIESGMIDSENVKLQQRLDVLWELLGNHLGIIVGR